ncbi:MAG: nucleotide exchange factor GrpE [Oscillospiraceae bacterium]|nr:nucleotide exchange factor GrpE [Oscillospiraceae bacterium]
MKMDKEKVTATEEQTEKVETSELDSVKEELENLKAEKDELYDKYLRTLAEYDNFRKRSQREKDAIYGDATAETVKKLLPVIDSFERALNYECKDEEFKKGISLIQNTLKEVFEGMGVKEIPDVGEQFNPNLHEAVMHTEDPAYDENVITDCYRKGYTLGDKVIRFSMVTVAN